MIILGCITKYKPEDIKPYVESIEQSGFKGRKVMMVYDIPQETIDYLKSKEWELYQNELQQHIILQRFRDIYKLLEQFPKDETIIWTDVKDVIFQTDPTKWIEKNMLIKLKSMDYQNLNSLNQTLTILINLRKKVKTK